MKLSEYIKQLEFLFETEGDLEVDKYEIGHRRSVPLPQVAFRKILEVTRITPRFWEHTDWEETKGEKVIRV